MLQKESQDFMSENTKVLQLPTILESDSMSIILKIWNPVKFLSLEKASIQ